MKIMLAEDDTNISTIAKISLEQLGGHKVTYAKDGEEALRLLLSSETFDVVLLDEMMPKMSGISVCKEYLAQVQQPSPVIFLSAKSQASDIADFLKLGIGHIPKPFDPRTLPKQIEDLVEIHKQRNKGAA